jgi:hypothetical protein
MKTIVVAITAAGALLLPGVATAQSPIWDPAGSAEGLAATVQEAAANPGAAAETTTRDDCTEANGPMALPAPPQDPLYAPPHPIPHGAPGTVLRIRATCVGIQNHKIPYRAWTIMYLTTGALNRKGKPSSFKAEPAVATGLVIAPIKRGPRAKRPLVAWAPAQDSNSTLVAPSYQVAMGWAPDVALIQEVLAQGWAVVLPDYQGPDSAFAAGPLEGHAFLDGIRAAENLSSEAGLAGTSTPVGMWGGSGGAIAVGWAAELQPRYAPELKVSLVAMPDVPGDMGNTFNTINDGYLGPGVAFAAFLGVATAYPELVSESLFNDAGKALAAQFRATGTNQYPSAVPPQHIEMFTKCGCNPVKDPKRFPGVAKAIRTVNLGQRVPTAPLFITHSYNDELMPFEDTARLVKEYCDAGATVNFRVLMGDEHITHGFVTWPEALATFTARFAGAAPVNTCSLPQNGGVAPPVKSVSIPPPLPPIGGARR